MLTLFVQTPYHFRTGLSFDVNLLQKLALDRKDDKAVMVAEVLVEYGVDPSAHSKMGTALHLACAHGNQVSKSTSLCYACAAR